MKDKKEKIDIFGHKMSRRELFWNAVAFLVIDAVYEIVAILSQLPEGWRSNSSLIKLENIEAPLFIPIILFCISFFLFKKSINGNKRATENDFFNYMINSFLLIFTMVIFNALIKIIILTILFL